MALLSKLGSAVSTASMLPTAALLFQRNGTHPVAPGTTGGEPPGGTPPGAKPDAGAGPSPMPMDLTPDIAGLLNIPRQQRSAGVAAAARPAPTPAERRVGTAILQLDGQEDEVFRWLGDPQTLHRLEEANIKPADLKARVGLMTDALRRQLTAWILAPDTRFPELPVASRLYQDAFDACRAVQMAGRVDIHRQNAALQQLRAFEAAASSRLPQLVQGTAAALIDFAAGNVDFRNVEDAALAFPCASSLRHTGDGAVSAVYPAGNIGGTPLKKARVGRPLLVAHGENPREVKVSGDGHQWTVTTAYTDTRVQAAQLEMWARLRQTARQQAVRRQSGLWIHW